MSCHNALLIIQLSTPSLYGKDEFLIAHTPTTALIFVYLQCGLAAVSYPTRFRPWPLMYLPLPSIFPSCSVDDLVDKLKTEAGLLQ